MIRNPKDVETWNKSTRHSQRREPRLVKLDKLAKYDDAYQRLNIDDDCLIDRDYRNIEELLLYETQSDRFSE